MRPLTTLVSAAVLAVGLAGGPAASAGGFEFNTLACPGPGAPTVYEERHLGLGETRRFGNSGMSVRITQVLDHDNGFIADFVLPGYSPRQVTFSGHPAPHDPYDKGPVVRFRSCGEIYDLRSEYGHPDVGNAITIQRVPNSF